jgi:hypothetical protein
VLVVRELLLVVVLELLEMLLFFLPLLQRVAVAVAHNQLLAHQAALAVVAVV